MENFSKTIIHWYQRNKRDLPWRNTQNPYYIWVSEIILQQTKVIQAIKYYKNFINKFATIHKLASASEYEVLQMWKGLGYYSRARNLHFAAKTIIEKYDGKFPTDYKNIIKLKGIGEYTAAAIASFAFKQPYIAIDGNVFRVLARIFGIDAPIDTAMGKKKFYELGSSLLAKKQPDVFNQAIIEFGAIQCTPKNYACQICVFQNFCWAFNNKSVHLFPVKKPKKKPRNRYFNYLVFYNDSQVVMEKRIQNDIWKNLYEFVLIETKQAVEPHKLIKSHDWNDIFHSFTALFDKTDFILKNISEPIIHKLTHQHIITRFYSVFVDDNLSRIAHTENQRIIVKRTDLDKIPVNRLIERYMQVQMIKSSSRLF